jgi:hypothetical protein
LQYGGLYVMQKIILGLILMCALGLILCWAGPAQELWLHFAS